MLVSGPSTPPWTCGSDVPHGYRFLCEDKYWSDVHTVTNFIVFYYLMDIRLSLLFMFFWESLEALIMISGGGNSEMDEKLGDSLVGDVVVGICAIFIGYLLSKYSGYRFSRVPPTIKRYWPFLIKYLFQIAVIAAPTGVLYIVPNYIGGGIISIAYIVFIVWVPGFFLVFAYWNRLDPMWITQERMVEKGKKIIVITNVAKQVKKKQYYRYHRNIALALFVWLLLFVYRWSAVFIMVMLYDLVLFVVLLSLIVRSGIKI